MKKFCIAKSKINTKAMREKEALQIFLNFATGALSTEEFWERYKNDELLRNALIKDNKRKKPIKWKSSSGVTVYNKIDDTKLPFNPDNLLETIDINSLEHRYQLFTVINRYLIARNIRINHSELNNDIKEYLFLEQLLPEWIGIDNISFLQNLMSMAPKHMSKTQQLRWGKAKIKELFKFDTKKPEWMQQPEWPIINGRPLIFSHQETDEEGFEKYYFYDNETNQQVVIEQCE